MTSKQKVPLFIMEEHHEAYFIWNYGYFKGYIRPFGNTLLHVDSHSDMAVSRLSTSIDELEDDLQQIYDFGYRELGIATFIIPAIYRGIINNYTYMCRYDGFTGKIVNRYAASYQSAGKYFQTGEVNPVLRSRMESGDYPWGRHQFFTYQQIGIAGKFATSQPLILDIDLDYFSCDNSLSSAVTRIEITEEAYREFHENKYHPFRIMPTAEYKAVKEGERCYFYSIEGQDELDRHKVSGAIIDKRIERFIKFLKENHLKPGMIDICRSRLSGYTPTDQWQYIENQLLEGLNDLYTVEVTCIDQFEKICGGGK